jgi:serine/threonine protein kinase
MSDTARDIGMAHTEDNRTRIVSTGALTPSDPQHAPDFQYGEAGALPVGSRLAEFEITALVGQGGFGAVYEAHDHALQRRVAIKEYLPVALSARQGDGAVQPLSERQRDTFELGMRSFINEARLLAQFDHPSLLKVYRFWQERGTAYMVMPFYDGQTLRQALAQEQAGAGVREDWLLPIIDNLTQALAVMHHAGCYHRDVAPDNILLLEQSGLPVLLDFGAARRVISDSTQAITVILKPGYAPVEQYAEIPNMTQGAWTDVYALAAVMHVAVTGQPPMAAVARLLDDHYQPLSAQPQLRERYSARLLATIDAGLAVRPEARPQSMAALRALLGLEGETATVVATQQVSQPATPVSAAAPEPTETTVPAQPSNRHTGLIAGALATIVLLAASAWWGVREYGASAPLGPLPASSAADPAPAPPAPAPPTAPPSEPLSGPLATASLPASAAASLRTPAEFLASLANGANRDFIVTATPLQTELRIGKDPIDFELIANRAGYVYVYLLSTSDELSLLFPNMLDKNNRIEPDQKLQLPRASWSVKAGGPPGVDRFAVMVSERERDFADSGIFDDGIFPQFPLSELNALASRRGSGGPPLLAGKPVCEPAAPCQDNYGMQMFEVNEKQ